MKNTETLKKEAKFNLRRDILQIMRRDPVEAEEILGSMVAEEGVEFVQEVMGKEFRLYPGYGYKFISKEGPLFGREIGEAHMKQAVKLESANKLFEIKRFQVSEDWLFFVNGQEEEAMDKLGVVRGEVHVRFTREFIQEDM